MSAVEDARATLEADYAGGEYSGGGYRYIEATPEALRTVLDALMPTADDERKTLMALLDNHDPEGGVFEGADIEDFWGPQTDAIIAAGFRRQGPPTDAQADAAQIAFHEFVFGEEEPMTRRQLGIARQAWRCALEAARDAS